ncbi:MAG: ABC transporter ATP-binding protein [Saprospiraceae bacterium]|nr:ABC transporter ATP-binding protein [Saprospiraceae bacterium]
MIEINNLSLEISNKIILENLNFSINEGILAILGLNGCGKTTLLKSLMGLLKLKKGTISINNNDIINTTKNALAKKIAFVPQEHNTYFNYTVSEMVLMGRTPHIKNFALPNKIDNELVDKALHDVDIHHLKNRNFLELSGGERRLVLIARALAQQTEIILFDEPTTFLDLKNSYLVLNKIKKLSKEKLVILTLHDLNQTLQCADNILMIFSSTDHIFGRIEDIITNENLKKLYNIPLEIVRNGNRIHYIRSL